MSDIIYSAAEPKGWVLNQNPTEKEKRFWKLFPQKSLVFWLRWPDKADCVSFYLEEVCLLKNFAIRIIKLLLISYRAEFNPTAVVIPDIQTEKEASA